MKDIPTHRWEVYPISESRQPSEPTGLFVEVYRDERIGYFAAQYMSISTGWGVGTEGFGFSPQAAISAAKV